MRIQIIKEVPGEYVREGETYIVTQYGKREIRFNFTNVDRGSSTQMSAWAYRRAMYMGHFNVQEA